MTDGDVPHVLRDLVPAGLAHMVPGTGTGSGNPTAYRITPEGQRRIYEAMAAAPEPDYGDVIRRVQREARQ